MLLGKLDFPYRIVSPPETTESYPAHLPPEEIPVYIAKCKSRACRHEPGENEILLTADTLVLCKGRILGKPENMEQAGEFLRLLSGGSHEVFTGVCLRSKDKEHSFCSRTKVFFKELTDKEINYYLNRYPPLDKAGAYGVQEWIGYIGILRIEGSYYNVMGLPVQQLYEALVNF